MALLLTVASPVGSQARYRLFEPARPDASFPSPVPWSPGRRSPVLAGSLSLVLPFGTGSFYAGHARHGVTHLVVGLAAATGTLVGSLDCIFSGISGEEHIQRSCAVAHYSAWAFVGNWGWGIVSAVNDARAHNRRTGTSPGR